MKATKRNVYLHMKSLESAKELWMSHFSETSLRTGTETIATADAIERILSEPVFARLSSPNYHAAAMDGIAVLAEDTYGAHVDHPIQLTLGENTFFVNTGNVLPEKTDAVIMIENVTRGDHAQVIIESPAIPWQHVRKMGEDIVATEMLFPQNHTITPSCIGAMLSGGVFQVCVRKTPNILIVPTGSELIDWQSVHPDQAPEKGTIIESNGTMLKYFVQECGCHATRHDSVPDDVDHIQHILLKAVQTFDMILLVGGSSAGESDYTRSIIENAGNVLLHGVTIMPGKPVILGDVHQTPIVGIPGYPVSAIVIFDQFIRPMLYHMLGVPEPKRKKIPVQLTRNMPSKLGIEEFIRVKLGKVGDTVLASALPRGAGAITTFTQADGIIRIPRHSEGLKSQDIVYAELLHPEMSIENTIMLVGSHDNSLDILSDCICQKYPGIKLASTHVGSLGGLLALKRGSCHMAGSHLLDAEDGSYNVRYIQKYLNNTPVKCMHLVMREQGMIVLPGNPKNIKSIKDLKRNDVRLINRQAGSGTRVLLDYLLQKYSIQPIDILGYDRDEYTHMGVAVNVLSGMADVGIGILSAANALKMDFIPIVQEQYDLVIPTVYWDTPMIQALVSVVRWETFQNRVQTLGGYHTDKTGQIIDQSR
ncbi:MAG: molybdopterin biosynthesis protein [Candidatus Magnetomorum sp.]|nr:molybdopterin biosynthesis protein [Candidatus Magnetomorum sp.]